MKNFNDLQEALNNVHLFFKKENLTVGGLVYLGKFFNMCCYYGIDKIGDDHFSEYLSIYDSGQVTKHIIKTSIMKIDKEIMYEQLNAVKKNGANPD